MLPKQLVAEAADIVIIGSGFAGAATAYHLARRGVRGVVLLEAEPRAGVHASGKNAALCLQTIENPDEARLAVEGTRVYAAPPEDLSPRPLLERHGSLLLATESGREALDSAARDAAALGVSTSIVSREEAIQRVALLGDSPFETALYNPEDGIVDIVALLEGYLTGARRAGAKIRFGELVRAIEVSDRRIASVTTSRGKISTPCLVNAAGAWAGEIGRMTGVLDRSIEPRRRHIFQLTTGADIEPAWPFVWHSEIDVYFRPEGDGILTSACDATLHPPETPSIDPEAQAELEENLLRAFPALAPVRVTAARACLRTFARDERFLIGRDPELGGLVWVAALGGHGMSTSYGVGRLGAAAVLGESSAELERFSPARLSG